MEMLNSFPVQWLAIFPLNDFSECLVPPKVVKRGQKFPPALFSGWRQTRQANKAMNFN